MEVPSNDVKVVAHRGASAVAPENTMAAFRAARGLGADGIELDVHAAADGELFVIHDYAVDRTTDGHGLVFDLSSSMISQLDAGAWFSPEFAGERVPQLSEVLRLKRLEFEVEIKSFTKAAMFDIVKLVGAAGVLERTEFTSSNTAMLMALKHLHPEARIGIFSRRREGWMHEEVFERSIRSAAEVTEADVIHVHAADITPRIVSQLHELGRIVHANDAESVADLTRALEAGADRTSTSDPGAAVFVRTPALD